MVSKSEKIGSIIKIYSELDKHRLFTFSSGHLGNLSYKDSQILEDKLHIAHVFLIAMRFFIYIAFPILQLVTLLRTIARVASAKFVEPSNSIFYVGIGNSDKNMYFDLIQKNQYGYADIRFVGGLRVKSSSNFKYIEIFLRSTDLLKLFLYSQLYPLMLACGLVHMCIKNNNMKIFLCEAFGEISNNKAFTNYVWKIAIKRFVENIENKIIIFPMEGRNWEKLLVSYSNRGNVTSIGYIHSAITPRNLALTKKGFYFDEEYPKKIITTGAEVTDYIGRIHSHKNILTGYFIRGESTDEYTAHSNKMTDDIIICLTGNIAEAEILCKIITTLPSKIRNKLIIRPNRNDRNYSKIKKLFFENKLRIFDSINLSIPKYCLYRSSTMAIHYMRMGVTPIYLRFDELVSNNSFELFDKIKVCEIKIEGLSDIVQLEFDDNFNTRYLNDVLNINFDNSDIKKFEKNIFK
jgi:hypothetical protein